MRTRHALIFFLLCLAHVSFAQNWQVENPYAYNDETVVYATLNTNVPNDPMTDFVMAAFVGDECRATATAPYVGNDGSQFFVLRVLGDQTEDLGKSIVFKVYHKPMGMTYEVTSQNAINYNGESVGTPSQPVVFNLDRQHGEPIALQSFYLIADTAIYGKTTRIKLEPNPANASFDAYSVQISFSGEMLQWTTVEQQRVTNDPLSFDITPLYPGQMMVQVTVGNDYYDVTNKVTDEMNSFHVGDILKLEKGWQWRSNAFGEIGPYNINMVFAGDNLIEARTQDGLLYNDPTWGYFGTLMESGIPQNTCYKVKMADEPSPVILTDGLNNYGYSIQLNGDWTWVAVPYYYDRDLADALDPKKASLPEGMVVVTKEDGSAEFDGTAWKGDLVTLRKGQGLMVYSPLSGSYTLDFTYEGDMPIPNGTPARLYNLSGNHWLYDASRFMNNTTVVAAIADAEELSSEWSIGVFAGNECRGEGHFIDGQFFITVHADRGEQVNMKLRHEPTGRTFEIAETLTAGQMRIGSISQPVMLHADKSLLGIDETRTVAKNAACYDMTGRKIVGKGRGIILLRQADGKVVKKIKK
ncbi:MAG: hypothetical protein K6F89_07105 [Prevotella sp.]|nr:hypothetical protein [Prevotella sp.]